MKRGVLLVLVFSILLFNFNLCLAADLQLSVTDINPSSVDADEDFTVGIQVLNNGKQDASNVSLEVKYLGDDIELKESNWIDLGFLRKGGGLKNVVYHFHTSPFVVPGDRVIELELSWVNEGTDILVSQPYNVSISILSDKPLITLSGVSSKPERIFSGDDLILTIRVENYGEGLAKNVRVFLDNLSIEGVKEVYLGEIEAHENLPARFVLGSASSGTYDYTAKILYELGGGEYEETFDLQLFVFDDSNFTFILIIICMVVLISLLFLFYSFKKKKKVD